MSNPRYIRRFGKIDRVQHLVLLVCFLGLAATGLPLLFSHARWAPVLAQAFGGFQVTGVVHRVLAIVLIGVFFSHVTRLFRRLMAGERSLLWGPSSLVPQPKDAVDLYRHVLWFLRRGPKPAFDRYTYWEKFDYWAVFWGMVVIGGSGLMLWFPHFFSRRIPGWIFNVALLVHGEEALLAVGFIVTIHFFNSHMRPSKFPMDTVMFTGVVEEREYAHERPLEVERLKASGSFEARLAPAPHPRFLARARVFGFIAIGVGLSLLLLILVAIFTR